MRRKQRRKALWVASIAALAIAAIVIPILVFADSEPVVFTATLYSDVVRFEADGAASLRMTIYDLSENELWSSGQVLGDFVDWDRANERGERLANGYYLYLAQGWDTAESLILNKAGKVVLLPGDQLELKAAPASGCATGNSDEVEGSTIWRESPIRVELMAVDVDHSAESWAFGQVGIGTSSPTSALEVMADSDRQMLLQRVAGSSGTISGQNLGNARFMMGVDTLQNTGLEFHRGMTGFNQGQAIYIDFGYSDGADYDSRLIMRDAGLLRLTGNASFSYTGSGNVGIGTTNVTDKLTIQGPSGNLIACYPSDSRGGASAVFRVESDGDVYADGTVYSYDTAAGGADVAERINVSEWVEPGDVVEIDPEHAGFFRKASGPYSRRVAGIISTSPGVILGNDVDPERDEWNDNRPVLAIAGRVPVKVSTENGPIVVGDLLVSSSVPGIAMKGDPRSSIGAVVGKAMESLDTGQGTIMAQVTLR